MCLWVHRYLISPGHIYKIDEDLQYPAIIVLKQNHHWVPINFDCVSWYCGNADIRHHCQELKRVLLIDFITLLFNLKVIFHTVIEAESFIFLLLLFGAGRLCRAVIRMVYLLWCGVTASFRCGWDGLVREGLEASRVDGSVCLETLLWLFSIRNGDPGRWFLPRTWEFQRFWQDQIRWT